MSETAENYLPKVRKQYEEYPYPERNPQEEKKILRGVSMARLDAVNHFCFKGRQDFNNFKVLIVGGGTGDSTVLWADQLQGKTGSSVTYLDMSTASEKIAKERAKVRQLDNITWINDSLLNLPDMDLGEFDFIDCSGVLHHLENPDAGLKALKSVLKPKGAMFIMVYAKYGRSGIYMMQDLMRLVNGDEENPKNNIRDTKEILENLPRHNWFKLSEASGLWRYSDTKHDSGIYDLFLHSQDRPYTILEVHEWLERCGLKMASEPGCDYKQLNYLPNRSIIDKKILKKIEKYPLKIQQAIGEAASTNIATHSFFVTYDDIEDNEASLDDDELIVYKGITNIANFEELAGIALQRQEALTITFEAIAGTPKLFLPGGKYIASLLRQIDGKRSVKEILEAVKNSPKYEGKKIDEDLLINDFKELFTSLNRGYFLFLKHKGIENFTNLIDLQQRVEDMYKK